MLKRCELVFCVASVLVLSAAIASAAGFDVSKYTCTNLGGVPRTYNAANPGMNFLAYSLSEQGLISGDGYWANIGGSGPPSLNTKVLLQCGYSGFGPASFSGGPYGVNPIVSNNSYYDNSGMPTSGIHVNTGTVYDDDYLRSFVGNDSGTFVFSGGNVFPTGGADVGHMWSNGSGFTAPAALANVMAGWINKSGLVAGGDYSSLSGSGNIGVAYDSVHGTSTAMPGAALYVNNAGQVTGTSNSYTQGWVWNQSASTYWAAGATNVPGITNAQSISQSGRYVAGFIGAYGTSTSGALYDAGTHSIVKSISGAAYSVNDGGWLGGDTDNTWGGYFNGTAWLWDGATQHDLNAEIHAQFPSTSEYTICAVWGIDNSNQVLVWGKGPGSYVESFLLNFTPGDANGDGKVDINDLSKVLTNYDHTGTTWADGDFNGDGKVDINDLSVVLSNYDHTVGSSAAGIATVPEPGTLALLSAGLAGLLAYAWRKQR